MSRKWLRRRLLGALGLAGAAGLVLPGRAAARDEPEPRMSREVLDGPRTYYVRSDALFTDAPGLIDSPAGACKTWARAIDLVEGLDFNGQNVTIQHGSETGPVTFAETLGIGALVGGGRLDIKGQTTPGNTVLDPGGTGILEKRFAGDLYLSNLKFGSANTHIGAVYGGTVNLLDGLIFGPASFAHIFVHDAQSIVIDVTGHTEIAGSAPYHYLVSGGMVFAEYNFVNLVGAPNWSGGYMGVTNGGKVQTVGTTFTGAATGIRYWVVMNSVINTFSSGATYLPGNVAGSAGSGGQYV